MVTLSTPAEDAAEATALKFPALVAVQLVAESPRKIVRDGVMVRTPFMPPREPQREGPKVKLPSHRERCNARTSDRNAGKREGWGGWVVVPPEGRLFFGTSVNTRSPGFTPLTNEPSLSALTQPILERAVMV